MDPTNLKQIPQNGEAKRRYKAIVVVRPLETLEPSRDTANVENLRNIKKFNW